MLQLPWVPEVFLARFPVPFPSAAREKPLVPRVCYNRRDLKLAQFSQLLHARKVHF